MSVHQLIPTPPDEAELYESAHFYPRNTGLPMTVWVRPKGGLAGNARVKVCRVHGERILLDDTVLVGVDSSELLERGLADDDQKAVRAWITANREALIGYWEGELGVVEFAQALQKV